MKTARHKALLNYLKDHKILPEEKIQELVKSAEIEQASMEVLLVKKGYLTEETLYSILADINKVPYVDLANYRIDRDILELIPYELARKHHVIPLFKIQNVLTVAMTDPADIVIIDILRERTSCDIDPCVSSPKLISKAIQEYYQSRQTINHLIGTLDKEMTGVDQIVKTDETETVQLEDEAPIVKLVNMTVTQAVQEGASDIHFEPDTEFLRVRFRIGGIMREAATPSKHLQSSILTRLKVMSDMDISETRVPQDGRFHIEVDQRQIDIRVSSVPTTYGENIVLRLLDVSGVMIGLEGLGFRKNILKRFEKAIRMPHGIILVTGPTGCGKTTTLYAALQTINSKDKNIVTIEDPVEYRLELIRQIQVHPKAGLTFATGLRSIMRQDPDIIMVGEIRDVETARLAIQAALTGHLVFSTLHTNDAPSAVIRLKDMGIEPFLIASTVRSILGQRLVRKLCEHCKEAYTPNPELVNSLGITPGDDLVFYREKGCEFCHQSGYQGRIGLFELMSVSQEIQDLIVRDTSAQDIKKWAQSRAYEDIKQDGIQKVCQGLTSLSEIYRVTEEEAV